VLKEQLDLKVILVQQVLKELKVLREDKDLVDL
jgi:hypothetical protein